MFALTIRTFLNPAVIPKSKQPDVRATANPAVSTTRDILIALTRAEESRLAYRERITCATVAVSSKPE